MAGWPAPPQQGATLTGNTWTVDYVLSDSEPSGCYTAEAVAVDALAAIYPDEAANHTGTARQSFGIHTAGPAAQIDRSFLTASQTLDRNAGRRNQRQLPARGAVLVDGGGRQPGRAHAHVLRARGARMGSTPRSGRGAHWMRTRTTPGPARCTARRPAI